MSLRPAQRTPAATYEAFAAAAFALTTSSDVAAHIDVCARAAQEAVGGTAWRFDHLDAETGTLRAATSDGPVILPAPGGALEGLLRHEAPLVREDIAGEAFGSATRGAVLGLPVRAGHVLFGFLRIALPALPLGGVAAPGVANARVFADLCALALERHAREKESALQRERMTALEGKADAGETLFSELIAVVAHEIRTPLTSIKAYTEALIAAPSDEFERRKEFLHVIDEECDRLGRLVGDALDLSRLEAGLCMLKVKPVTPSSLLEDVALALEPDAAKHKVKLVLEAGAALDDVEADGDLVKQLLFNLVGNAIKFSPADTTVTLRAEPAGESVWRLSVTDQGGGIPEDQLERIFERFHRVELKSGRRVQGTGLGLAIARHIVDLHGGRLWVENAPGGGSIFSALLPRRQLAPAQVRSVAAALADRADVTDLLDAAMGMIAEVMAADIVSTLLVDPSAGDLCVAAARGLDEAARAQRMHYRGGVAGAVLSAGQPVLVEDIETDRRFGKKSHPQYSTKSLLCAPLAVGGVTVGVVNVTDKRARTEFDEADLELLTSLVGRIAAALSRAHAYPDSTTVLAEAMASVQSVARVKRDLWLGASELARYANHVAERMGVDAATAAAIAHLAAGKSAPPVSPEVGDAARLLLLSRAERLDGSGRPYGRRDEAIPMGARILGVIDEFECLTHGRPYRTALTIDEALAALRAAAGTKFDAAVIEAFAASLADEGWTGDGREEAA